MPKEAVVQGPAGKLAPLVTFPVRIKGDMVILNKKDWRKILLILRMARND